MHACDFRAVTPDTWDSFSNYNSIRAEAEMKASAALREAINYTIQQTNSDLDTQRMATDRAFRKRIHEMEQVISELEWQQQNTKQEISDVQTEIQSLQKSISEKQSPMMVAQTRLENRNCRPNVELCRDEAQYGLVEEVYEIAGSIQSLMEKLAVAENNMSTLVRSLTGMEENLAVKANSLNIDKQCMETRMKLTAAEGVN
jgi:tektin-2